MKSFKMNLIKILIVSLTLLVSSNVRAETLIIPVSDLLLDVPNFKAPTYDFNAGLNGEYAISEIPKTKREKKERERKLINMVYDIYPDAISVRIWNGNFIIKLPDETEVKD